MQINILHLIRCADKSYSLLPKHEAFPLPTSIFKMNKMNNKTITETGSAQIEMIKMLKTTKLIENREIWIEITR